MTPARPSGLPPVAGYHPTTLIDWPGRLASVIFLPRCNFRCPFCHSGSLLAEPQETIPFEAILEHVRSREGWIDGVVICGGEPTLWPGLGALAATLRREGLRVKLDTNGSRPERLRQLLGAGLLDAVAMDVKAPLDARYYAAAGTEVPLDALEASIDLLTEADLEVEFRTTCCPRFVGEAEIHAIGSRLAGARRWVLQRFVPTHALDPELREVEPYGPAEMEALAEIGRAYLARCVIRGQPEALAAPSESG